MHISLKVDEQINIGGVSAPVILAMVGLNFVRRHRSWEVMFFMIGPMLFLQQVKYPSVPSLRSFLVFLL